MKWILTNVSTTLRFVQTLTDKLDYLNLVLNTLLNYSRPIKEFL